MLEFKLIKLRKNTYNIAYYSDIWTSVRWDHLRFPLHLGHPQQPPGGGPQVDGQSTVASVVFSESWTYSHTQPPGGGPQVHC